LAEVIFKNSFLNAGIGFNCIYMIPILIAGGSMLGTLVAPQIPDLPNHLLTGSTIPAKQVVCRTRWGTPMMPDGKGSYSLLSGPDPVLIERSLVQPPKTEAPIFRPASMQRSVRTVVAPAPTAKP
jgi:hypothetical protein